MCVHLCYLWFRFYILRHVALVQRAVVIHPHRQEMAHLQAVLVVDEHRRAARPRR